MENNTVTKLALITKRSIKDPKERFHNLKHLLNSEYLMVCYEELKKNKAAGIDGRTKESYTNEEIKEEIETTVSRMKKGKYKPKPVKRVNIPKSKIEKRLLGIPTVIDKVVQLGITKILESIYEPQFRNTSYGFRPKKNCHEALKAVYKMVMTKQVNWIIDADIKGFFDNVDHNWLIKCIEERISDKKFRHFIIKFLKAGIMEEGKIKATRKGTPQGGILSPILANIYLHYVLDLWFEAIMKEETKGYTEIVRYCDDFIIGVETKEEAMQILKKLKERLKKFKLELSMKKTKIIEFGRYAQKNSKRRGKRKADTFEFLGMTHYCSKSLKGKFLMKVRTSKKRMNQKLKEMNIWLKKIRNLVKIKEIWKLLSSKLRGHYNYYGISSNSKSIQNYYYQTIRLTFKWMNRRSQKQSFSWVKFIKYMRFYPLPKPSIKYNMYNIW